MFRKLSTKTLLILMAILGAIVWFTYFSDSGSGDSTFRNVFLELDTAAVTTVLIYPKAEEGREVRFEKNQGRWQLSNGQITTLVDSQTVAALLGQFTSLASQSLAANSSDLWDEFQVGDTSGTRIKFVTPAKTWDVMVGKFGYNNQTRAGISYVRMFDEKEVYTVDGFLSFSVNQPFNNWRNRNLTKGGEQQWKKISFIYPADSGFVMTNEAGNWLIDGMPCDSTPAAAYVQEIANLTSTGFLDAYSPASNPPAYRVRIERDNAEPIVLQAYPADSTIRFALHSSLNPEAYFSEAQSNIVEKLFIGKNRLLR